MEFPDRWNYQHLGIFYLNFNDFMSGQILTKIAKAKEIIENYKNLFGHLGRKFPCCIFKIPQKQKYFNIKERVEKDGTTVSWDDCIDELRDAAIDAGVKTLPTDRLHTNLNRYRTEDGFHYSSMVGERRERDVAYYEVWNQEILQTAMYHSMISFSRELQLILDSCPYADHDLWSESLTSPQSIQTEVTPIAQSVVQHRPKWRFEDFEQITLMLERCVTTFHTGESNVRTSEQRWDMCIVEKDLKIIDIVLPNEVDLTQEGFQVGNTYPRSVVRLREFGNARLEISRCGTAMTACVLDLLRALRAEEHLEVYPFDAHYKSVAQHTSLIQVARLKATTIGIKTGDYDERDARFELIPIDPKFPFEAIFRPIYGPDVTYCSFVFYHNAAQFLNRISVVSVLFP